MTLTDANDFLTAAWGRFVGVRTWEQLDAVWAAVRADAGGGWYLYTLERPPPITPAAAGEVESFVADVDSRLRSGHRVDYCGFVYVDAPAAPTFIKVFEPKKFGGCGHGTGKALPGWILSKLPPADLPASLAVEPGPRPWWKKALGRV